MDLLLGAATGGGPSRVAPSRATVVSPGVDNSSIPGLTRPARTVKYPACVLASPMRRVRSVGAEPVDAVLPGVIALIGVAEMIANHYTPIVVALGTLLVGCAATVLRRSHPIPSAVGVLASFAAAPLLGFDVSQPRSWMLLLVLASFAVGRYLPRRALLAGLGVVVGLLLGAMGTLSFLTKFSPDLVFGVVAIIGPWAAP